MNQETVLPYIPQRPPFVMIDVLESADENSVRSSFTVREGHLFVENGFFTEPGLVENMAQTAAAGTGFRAQAAGEPAPVGFIGALKGFQLNALPATGETIHTEVTFVHAVMNAHIVQARIRCGDREVATCELKIFLQSNASTPPAV